MDVTVRWVWRLVYFYRLCSDLSYVHLLQSICKNCMVSDNDGSSLYGMAAVCCGSRDWIDFRCYFAALDPQSVGELGGFSPLLRTVGS